MSTKISELLEGGRSLLSQFPSTKNQIFAALDDLTKRERETGEETPIIVRIRDDGEVFDRSFLGLSSAGDLRDYLDTRTDLNWDSEFPISRYWVNGNWKTCTEKHQIEITPPGGPEVYIHYSIKRSNFHPSRFGRS
jgi:hypothetical protein